MDQTYKIRAIELRKEGKTYSEIRAEIPVAKSTLSDWLGSVGLTKPQKQRITLLKKKAQSLGAKARRDKRLREVEELLVQGIKDIGKLSKRELWLIGIALHWAEGSKQNARSPSTGIVFGNSDPKMIQVFIFWLKSFGITLDEMVFSLYVHTSRKVEVESFKGWWGDVLSIDTERIDQICFKKGNPKTLRTNVGDLYHGLIRIRVKSSTVLNRQVNGWFNAIYSSLLESEKADCIKENRI